MEKKFGNDKDKKSMTTTRPEFFMEFPETPDLYRTEFPTYWSPYKTPIEKLAYVKRITSEIQPFIRSYFQKHKAEMLDRIESEELSEYTGKTKDAWAKHLDVNQAIDCFLNYELGSEFGDWSPEEWRVARDLLAAGMDSDHAKAMYSGGIKDKLEIERRKLVARYGVMNPDFEHQLLTLSFPTFYESRVFSHKKYKLSVLDGRPDEALKGEIANKYYGGDNRLFDLRDQETKSSDDPEILRREIEASESSFRQRFAKKQYLMLERPDVRAFDDLLYFDNVTEYEYTYSLKGLPDLFLRDEILRRLTEAGLMPRDTNVFSLAKEDFFSAIDLMLAKLATKFEIRLRQYRQTSDTCGTACIMSVLNRKGLPLNEVEEMAIWSRVGRPYNFPGGLANVLLKFGFNVDYIQDSRVLLSKENPEFAVNDPHLVAAAEQYVGLHEEAVASGLHFESRDWSFDDVRSEIVRGNVCLIYIHVSAEVSHCVLAHGIKNGRLLIIDPLNSIKSLDSAELNARIKTPMGKRMLVVKKLPRDMFDTLRSKLHENDY